MGMDAMSLTAPVFGIIGAALIAIFVAGGSSDNDGQGTNMGWALFFKVDLEKAEHQLCFFLCSNNLSTFR